MAETGLKAFEAALNGDETLQQKYEEALRAVEEAASDERPYRGPQPSWASKIPIEELERVWAAMQELDEDELDAVVGGALDGGQAPTGPVEDEYGHDRWCLTAWHCSVVTLHTETKSMRVACWSDYQCLLVNNLRESMPGRAHSLKQPAWLATERGGPSHVLQAQTAILVLRVAKAALRDQGGVRRARL